MSKAAAVYVLGLIGWVLVGKTALASTPESEPELPVHQELWLVDDHVNGVGNRLYLEYNAAVPLGPMRIILGGGVNMLQRAALSHAGLGVEYEVPVLYSRVGATAVHQSWVEYGASENRFVAYWTFLPVDTVEVIVGIGYRAPQFSDLSFGNAVSWPRTLAEWHPVYRVRWEFLQLGPVALAAAFANYDRMRLYAADDVHFLLEPKVHLMENLTLNIKLAVDVGGVSGAVLSLPQQIIGMGVSYDLF